MMTDVSCIRKDRLLRIDRKPPEIKPQTRLNHYLSKYGLNIRDGHTCIEQKLNQEHIECTMSTKSALSALNKLGKYVFHCQLFDSEKWQLTVKNGIDSEKWH